MDGPVCVTSDGLEEDGQADLVHHGGFDKAVLAYCTAHYDNWRTELELADMGPGGLGENLAVTGMDETSVCIGDVFSVGTVLLQVSQPRKPCATLERRWGRQGIIRRIIETTRCGWYLRVLEEGRVGAGDEIRLADRPHPDWSVSRAFGVRMHWRERLDEAAELAGLPELSLSWKDPLARTA